MSIIIKENIINFLKKLDDEKFNSLSADILRYRIYDKEPSKESQTQETFWLIQPIINKQIKTRERCSLWGKKSRRGKISPIKDIFVEKKEKTPENILIELDWKTYSYPKIKLPMESEDGIKFTLQWNVVSRDNIIIVKDLDWEYYCIFWSQTAKYIWVR